MDNIKNFLTGMLSRWLLKIGGTWFASIGIENGQIELVIGGVVAIIFGLIISLFQHKKALDTPVS